MTHGPGRPRSAAVKPATIKDVAREAGVSLQTVSRVINKGPNVTAAMTGRVERAVAKLGYVPSLAARRLGGSRSFLILALNDSRPTIQGWKNRRGNDWVDQMLYGGMLKAAEHGYRMLFELVDSASPKLASQVLGAIGALHPDGVILTPPHTENDAIIALLIRAGIPFARLGSSRPGPGHAIFMDDEAAAVTATGHLVGLGHRRIAFIGGPDAYDVSRQRLAGYGAALAAAGIAANAALVRPGDFTFDAGERGLHQLLELGAPPTAIITSSDETALGVLHAAGALGLSVPRDLSITSFDDTPSTRLSTPPLTSISQPIAGMAARATEILIQAKADDLPAGEGGAHLLPYSLEVRGSSAPPRGA